MSKKKNVKTLKKENEELSCCICERVIQPSKDNIEYTILTESGKYICKNCAEDICGVTETIKKNSLPNMVPNEVKLNSEAITKRTLRSIKGQDSQVTTIVNTIVGNYQTQNPILKNNILIIGKSGHGKTETIRQVFKNMQIPYTMQNATDFTPAGYIGKNKEEMLLDLIDSANGDIELAQKGVIIIDEFDKIRTQQTSQKDISGEEIQNAILGYMSGEKVILGEDESGNVVSIDTSNITFICMGAFEGLSKSESLYAIREKRLTKKHIGFYVERNENALGEYTAEDLYEYGIIRQITGRLEKIIELNSITPDVIKSIILTSKISIVSAYLGEFKKRGVKLYFAPNSLDMIAEKAFQNNIGARGIKKVINEFMPVILEEVEKKIKIGETVKACHIYPDIVRDTTAYQLKK